MKKLIKSLLLGAVVIGTAVGCNFNHSHSNTQVPSSTSSNSSSASESTTSSIASSSSSSSITSSSSSSSSSISSSSTSSSSTSIAPTLTGIALNADNVKKAYNYGDKLDLTGLVVAAKYSDNTTVAVTDYTTYPANDATLIQLGEVSVRVDYQNFSESFTITVAKVLTGITLNTNNVKKEYYVGESLDLTGLVVTAKYNDYSNAPVNDYTSNPVNGATFNEIGKQTITIAYQEKTATFEVNVNKPIKAAWTEEEAKIMSDNLHGVVLPYSGFEESVVTYDAEKESVFIKGGTLAADSLANYATAMINAGFERVNDTAYVFEKSVAATEGTRYVRVGFKNDEGQFFLQALDPYYYEFPTFFAENYASQYIGSEDVAPALPGADYYDVNSQYRVIMCYMECTTEDGGYSDILRAAGWRVQEEKDSYGYFVAVSPDYSYQVSYLYQPAAKRVAIYFELIGKWQTSFFTEFFTEYSPCVIDVPVFEGKEVTYLYMISGTTAMVSVNGATNAEVVAYATKVEQAGWDVNCNNDIYKAKLTIANVGVANMTFYYNAQYGSAILMIYGIFDPLPVAQFPSEEVARILGEDITDVVPVYQGEATGYTIVKEGSNNVIKIAVEKGTEKGCAAAYLEYIQTQGYALEEGYSTIYVSANKQIYIQSNGINNSGEFTITFRPVPYTISWPTKKIARFLGNDIDTVIPALDDDRIALFELDEDNDGLWIKPEFKEDADYDIDEVLNDYIKVLEENKFFVMLTDEDGTPYYVSPDLKVVVIPFVQDGDLYILINTVAALTYGQWPEYHLAYFLEKHGYTDKLPAYEGEFVSANAEVRLSSLKIDVVLETEDAEEIKAEADGYAALLVEEGFKLFEEMGENGQCRRYYSPNKQYEVSVMYQPNGFTVQIDEIANEHQTTTTFPTENLYAEHPELEGVLPVVVDGEATFSTQIQSDYIEIFVMYEDTSLIAGAQAAYEESLLKAGFTAQEDTYGYELVYLSPDHTYYVAVTDWSTYETPGFDIEIFYDID